MTHSTAAVPPALAAMLDRLPAAAVWELERALTRQLRRVPTAAEERVRELGPLARLLAERGRPATGTREASEPEVAAAWLVVERAVYDAHGPDDAARSGLLVERYGSWRKACRAASGLRADGRTTGPGKPWRSTAGVGPRRIYGNEDLVAAIRACARALGRRPSSSDYARWCRARRAYLRQGGSSDRVPTLPVILARFGSWSRALSTSAITDADLSASRAVVGEESQLPSADDDLGRVASAVLSEEEQRLIGERSFAALPLSRAALIAQHAGVSLDWLAGRTANRGQPVIGVVQFDGQSFARRRRQARVPEAQVRQRLGLPLGPYRQLLSGTREATLAQVATLAALVCSTVDALVVDDPRHRTQLREARP